MLNCIVIKETAKAKLVFAQDDQIKFWIPKEIFNTGMTQYALNDYGVQLPRWFKLTLLDVNLKPIV